MIPDVQHAVDTGVHQLLLVVAQVLGHILRNKYNVTLHIHHKEEAVQGLEGRRRIQTYLFIELNTLMQKSMKVMSKQMQEVKNMFAHLNSHQYLTANTAAEQIIKHIVLQGCAFTSS